MTLEKWLDYLCNLLGIVSWPVVVLIVFGFLRKPIILFINQINEAELPGGVKLKTIPKELKKAEEIKDKIINEKKEETKDKTIEIKDYNKIMISQGLEPSPSNLNMDYYNKILEQNPNIALAGLRIDLEIMLRNLAKGFNIDIQGVYSTIKICDKLLNQNAITVNQYKLIKSIFTICNAAVHGQNITKDQALQIFEMAPVLIYDYVLWLSWGFQKK
jgi:hypothetical protein